MKQTCAQFLAEKLHGSSVREWDSAPQSFDFDVYYRSEDVSPELLRQWMLEFFERQGYVDYTLDGNCNGRFVSEGRAYVVTITHSSEVQYIRGTFMSIE